MTKEEFVEKQRAASLASMEAISKRVVQALTDAYNLGYQDAADALQAVMKGDIKV